jgi:hypothetical protein
VARLTDPGVKENERLPANQQQPAHTALFGATVRQVRIDNSRPKGD